ncbi:UEV domain-containing protein [Choanephora cucurbitarum]|nr:UEV domain-containing protein [Choanephora cucurbitarum]
MNIESWLRTVLQHYQDPDKTFRDVDAVLQTYLSLKPKMDAYTSNDGHTQLLLCLHGTIPITYRSIPYNIPVAFWIPREYPKIAPIPYVKPTSSMLIREGRHVDKSGMCYHHYRSSWSSDQKHTIVELVAILQQVFGQEPPVYTKPASMAVPSNSIGSPQFQESLLDKASPSPQHPPQRSFSNGSPSTVYTSPELHRRTGEGIYQLNQSLAGLNLNSPNPLSASTSTSTSLLSTPTTIPPNSDHSSLHNQLYRKVAERLQQHKMSVSEEIDKLLRQNQQLAGAGMTIEQIYRASTSIKQALEHNNRVLEAKSKEIDQVIEKVNAMPDVQVDEALCGTTVVANQ